MDDRFTFQTDKCKLHGWRWLAHASNGLCAQCYEPDGKLRVVEDGRAIARHHGLREFNAVCPTHGPARHGVLMGKCLSCFSPTGNPRRRGYLHRG